MRENFKMLTTSAVLAALVAGSSWYAYAEAPEPQGPGGMMQGDQRGMTNMLDMAGQMSEMAQTCDSMMKETSKQQGEEKSGK